MKFTFVSKDVKLTESMKESSIEKLDKFERYFKDQGEVNCVVTISVLPNLKTIEASIQAKNFTLRAKAGDQDFYNALDLLTEKLEGQLRKVKTQMKRNEKKHSFASNLLMDEIIADELEPLDVVKKKHLSLAPMDLDEAITRMDALGHNFFIYLDSTTGLVNVLYEREDKKGYGVIEIEK